MPLAANWPMTAAASEVPAAVTHYSSLDDADSGEPVGDIYSDLRLWQSLAGVSACLALIASMIHIIRHTLYNRSRGIKECTLRMLVLVPLYAMDAFICVLLPDTIWPHLLTALRDFYEAVVLASFVQFLLVVLGGPGRGAATALAEKMLLHKPEHTGPLCIWRRLRLPVGMFWTYKAGPDFVAWVLIGILQYSVVMLTSLFARILLWPSLAYLGLLGSKIEKYFDVGLLQIKACSCGWAMYNLILLGVNLQTCSKTKHRVEEISLEVKFLSVKGIVFFTFLQQWGFKMFIIRLQEPNGDRMQQMSADSVRDLGQNCLLCFETLLFAFWHWRAYTVDEFNKMAMRMQLNEAMLAVNEVQSNQAASHEALHAHRELERAIVEAKTCLEQQFVVGSADYGDGMQVLTPSSPSGSSPWGKSCARRLGASARDYSSRLTRVNGDVLPTVVLSDFSARHHEVPRPICLVLQDEALRNAELQLAAASDLLGSRSHSESNMAGAMISNDSSCSGQTWACMKRSLGNCVRFFLCDFWFCLFWPKGTVGIFATFTLYDEIRKLRTKSESYRSAVQVLPAANGRRGGQVTDEMLNEAFDTFDVMAGGRGDGCLGSREELQTLAAGLGTHVDLDPLFSDTATPVDKSMFVERLREWHHAREQIDRESTPVRGIVEPLLAPSNSR